MPTVGTLAAKITLDTSDFKQGIVLTKSELRTVSRIQDEMLGPILLTIHNLAYYNRLMQGMRDAIEAGTFGEFYQVSLARLGSST